MESWRAPFMRWFENDFFGSQHVRRMHPLARLMYRSVLQAAWHSDRPPYAPNVDSELILLADAPSQADWEQHKPAILQRFCRTDDGKWLYHPKALSEFRRVQSEHERKSEAGKRAMKERWGDKDDDSVSDQQKQPATDHAGEAVSEVWNYYLAKVGRDASSYEFTQPRRAKALARFRECMQKTDGDWEQAAKLMKAAVDGLAASNFHMGRDQKTNGKKYIEWEKHLFKSYEQMEGWWNQ